MLNKLIKEFFMANKNRISNAEILGTIEKYNLYFSVQDKDDKENIKIIGKYIFLIILILKTLQKYSTKHLEN